MKAIKSLRELYLLGYLENEPDAVIPLVPNSALEKNKDNVIAIASCVKSEFTYLLSMLGKNSTIH